MKRLFTPLLLAAAALTAGAAPALAADAYPSRPVTLVVPFPPGGPTDALARRLAEKLKTPLGQTVIVENRAGAGGNIGSEYVAAAKPDGYTILFGTSGPLAINVSLYKNQGYNPETSFAPIIRIGHLPNILVVNPSVPANNAQELIAYARKNPDKLSYASSGNGASSHLAGILFNQMAGTQVMHIPYKGTGPALNDLLADRYRCRSPTS
jgi:tripartite-type tricarboxylate transporter receptor subunit TctC